MKENEYTHQAYYNTGNIEVITALEDWGMSKDFCLGNVIKYVCRAGKKNPDTEREDLGKALWYLRYELDRQDRVYKQQLGDTNG